MVKCVSSEEGNVVVGEPVIIHIVSAIYPSSYNFNVS